LQGERLDIEFEFSVSKTPPRNVIVKIKYQTLYGRVRSILNDAGIKDKMRSGIWAKCASTAVFCAKILVNCESGKSPHESKFRVKFKKLRNSKRFGEIIVVVTKNKIQEKLNKLRHGVHVCGVLAESFGRCLAPVKFQNKADFKAKGFDLIG
jgi:hypothetical protein